MINPTFRETFTTINLLWKWIVNSNQIKSYNYVAKNRNKDQKSPDRSTSITFFWLFVVWNQKNIQNQKNE